MKMHSTLMKIRQAKREINFNDPPAEVEQAEIGILRLFKSALSDIDKKRETGIKINITLINFYWFRRRLCVSQLLILIILDLNH